MVMLRQKRAQLGEGGFGRGFGRRAIRRNEPNSSADEYRMMDLSREWFESKHSTLGVAQAKHTSAPTSYLDEVRGIGWTLCSGDELSAAPSRLAHFDKSRYAPRLVRLG